MGDVIEEIRPLGFPWHTYDPFLFCVHHLDAYPKGNEQMGPQASLDGRRIGMDFDGKDGWSMYHGDVVPGFPRHPHRGFETVTIARDGFIDHSDSLGATARFGHGDTQWMTAGGGIVHSEMFPLVNRDADNPTELFQIWLNLPAEDKLKDAYFTMLWSETIPHVALDGVDIAVVAGKLEGAQAPSPPPSSWASREESDIAIWTLKLPPGARTTLPPAAGPDTNRALYVFGGDGLRVGGQDVPVGRVAKLRADVAATIENGETPAEALMLQGRPIGEPVAHYGPFVMNTQSELQQAFVDYRRTEFGGWPWSSDGPVHPREHGRFAVHADGRREEPPKG